MSFSTASAPGKLILFGEHAVVYGVPAVAVSLADLRVPARVSTNSSGFVSLTFPEINSGSGGRCELRWSVREIRASALDVASFFSPESGAPSAPDVSARAAVAALSSRAGDVNSAAARAAAALLWVLCGVFHDEFFPAGKAPADDDTWGVAADVLSPTLPVGAGLGSSAAVSVATAAAALDAAARARGGVGAALARPLDGPTLAVVNAWAFAAESVFHGSPSGLDNTVSTHGGALSFTRNEGSGAGSLRTTSTAPLALPPSLRVLVVNTHEPKDTAALVARVAAFREAYPALVGALLDALRAVAHRVRDALAAPGPAGDAEALATCARVSHGVLCALGVGHASLDRVCAAAARRGLGAKLTGAGGGGSAYVLLRPDGAGSADEIALVDELRAMKSAGGASFSVFSTSLGGDGARLED